MRWKLGLAFLVFSVAVWAAAVDVARAGPIVFGEMRQPGARRTLGIYVHYDGQPTDPADWTTSGPWTPALYTARHDEGGKAIPFPKAGEPVDPEWRIYARSAGDDKAPLIALLTVLDAFREEGIAPAWNVKFFFDSEEENGSPHLNVCSSVIATGSRINNTVLSERSVVKPCPRSSEGLCSMSASISV